MQRLIEIQAKIEAADRITADENGTMSRSSATPARGAAFFTYKGKPVDLRQIGRKLNVRYVLEGSVQRASQSATQAGKASCDPQHEAPPCKPKYPVVWAARRRQPILRLARAAGIAPNADELGMEALPTLSR
jgi:hypothetical protein